MQCSSNCYISVIFLVIKNINLWKSLGLDYILKQRDRIFKLVGVGQPLAANEVPLDIIVEGHSASKKILAHENNLLARKNKLLENDKRFSDSERDNGAIFMS